MDRMTIRPSALAGTWYPANPAELRLSVEGFFSKAETAAPPHEPAVKAALRALVLPHAGHKYSGRTCAAGVRRARGASVTRLILIGPSHRAFVRGAVLSGAAQFETPLGPVPVDLPAVRRISSAGVPVSDDPHAPEHCLEILLPFFQVALGSFRIVPMLIGDLPDSERRRLAQIVRESMDDRTLLVASSDFVHYGEDFGYTPDVGRDERAGVRRIDEGAIERIRAMDADGLMAYHERTGVTICGIRPIAVVLDVLPKSARVEFIDYSQSADVTGDTDHMVSYAALAFYDS